MFRTCICIGFNKDPDPDPGNPVNRYRSIRILLWSDFAVELKHECLHFFLPSQFYLGKKKDTYSRYHVRKVRYQALSHIYVVNFIAPGSGSGSRRAKSMRIHAVPDQKILFLQQLLYTYAAFGTGLCLMNRQSSCNSGTCCLVHCCW